MLKVGEYAHQVSSHKGNNGHKAEEHFFYSVHYFLCSNKLECIMEPTQWPHVNKEIKPQQALWLVSLIKFLV